MYVHLVHFTYVNLMAVALLIFLRLDIIHLGLVLHQFGRMAVDLATTEEIKKVLQTRQKVSVRG